jgi:acid phosphatase (class A)
MGGGWLGGGWQGGGWQGGGWQGGGWQGGGWASGGGEGLYAMRPDRPLVSEDLNPDFNGTPKYPPGAWDSDLFALHFLPDFFTAKVAGKTWDQAITVNTTIPKVVMPGGVVSTGDDSIDDLRLLAVTERPEAMGEILNQHQNQQLCFMQLLMMTASSHPKTFFAMKLAARVGEVVMIRLKRQFNRPRPSQYYPALYPPLAVPGHASYPAGHALIARLTARVLIEVTTPSAGTSPYEKSLIKLADEIGFNRVIAGLHFRSDIKEGAAAGDLTHKFLTGMTPRNPTAPDFDYKSIATGAKGEWS